jgi:hypothetical protein
VSDWLEVWRIDVRHEPHLLHLSSPAPDLPNEFHAAVIGAIYSADLSAQIMNNPDLSHKLLDIHELLPASRNAPIPVGGRAYHKRHCPDRP